MCHLHVMQVLLVSDHLCLYLLLLGPPFFPIILFLSTTLSTEMTGSSLHTQWPLNSQSHGSFLKREQLVFRYGSNSTHYASSTVTVTLKCIKNRPHTICPIENHFITKHRHGTQFPREWKLRVSNN
jgi:hypothetical protein